MSTPDNAPWYAVRCVIWFPSHEGAVSGGTYEERVTLWRAASVAGAVERAEIEAKAYAESLDAIYVGSAQAFHLSVNWYVGAGDEVFSSMRDSELPPTEYISRFFETGHERQRKIE